MYSKALVDVAADAMASFIVGMGAATTAFGGTQNDQLIERTIEHCVDRDDCYSMAVADALYVIRKDRDGVIMDPDLNAAYEVVKENAKRSDILSRDIQFEELHATVKQRLIIEMEDVITEMAIVNNIYNQEFNKLAFFCNYTDES